ncbi:hypothetical protein LVJ94_51365 [Pendulispora rubella]|uniref:Mannosyltransferase n=1 Tax=Pendulispora rubella TaxID=2741070 RepID=A0ABZ2L2X5_9BACT
MAPATRTWNAWCTAFWCTTLVTVAPLFAGKFLPFVDLPEHVASIATMHDLAAPHSVASQYYDLAIARSPYVLYHAVGALLTSVAGSAEHANLVLLALAGIALPLSFRSLLRALGRDERLAIFAPMLFWNRALLIGFLPFIASIPLAFFALGMVARQAQEPRRSRAIVLAVLAVVLFYVHLSSYIFFSVTAFFWSLLPSLRREAGRRLPDAIRRVVWMVPSGVTAMVWFVLGKMTVHGDSLTDADEIGSMGLVRALHALPLWTFDIWLSHVDEVCAGVWWGAFFVIAVTTLRRDMRREASPAPWVQLYIPLACAMLAYLLIPFRVGAGTMLNVRLAPLIALSALLPLELDASRLNVRLLPFVAAASLVTSAWAGYEVWTYSHVDMAGFDALLAKMKPGTSVMTLNFDASSPRRHWLGLFSGSYHRARGGGVASYSFAELHHWPIHYVESVRPPRKPVPFFILAPCVYRNRIDGAYFDYILVQGKDVDPFADGPPGPVFRKVDETSRFVLFEKVKGENFPDWSTDDEGPCVPHARVSKADAPE